MIINNRFSIIRDKIHQTQFLTYAYLLFLAGFFLSPSTNLHRNFFYLFIIAPFIVSLDAKFVENCLRNRLTKASLLFLLYYLTCMFWSDGQLSIEECWDISRYFITVVIFILTTAMISAGSPQTQNKIYFWLGLIALIAAISFFIVFYESHRFPRDRLQGPFSYTKNPNQASMYFGFVGVIAFSSAFFEKISWKKAFFWIAVFISFGYIVFSRSRGPLLAFVISVVLGLSFRKSWKTIAILITLFVLLSISAEIFSPRNHSIFHRGFSHRIELWTGAIQNIAEAPLFGKGYFSDVNIPIGKKVLSPHNLLLMVTSKGGIIGGGLLLILITTAILHSYKYYIVSGNWIFLCIFAYFIVCMTFDSTYLLSRPTLGWLIFWMPVGLIIAEDIRRNPIKSKVQSAAITDK